MKRELKPTPKLYYQLDDNIIRQEYIKYLKSKNDQTILHELNVCDGDARIDLAVIDNEKLVGIEIKSELDNLSGLESQKVFFDYTFQTISIIVTKKHLANSRDEEIVPDFWEIILAEKNDQNEIKFTTIREAGVNPHWSTKHIGLLLNKTEINNILPQNNNENLSKKELCLKLQNKYNPEEMTKIVLNMFKSDSRKSWLEKSIKGYTTNYRRLHSKKLKRR